MITVGLYYYKWLFKTWSGVYFRWDSLGIGGIQLFVCVFQDEYIEIDVCT